MINLKLNKMPNSFSYSSVSTYLECPRKFYFQKTLDVEIPENRSSILGQALHYLLRKYYENKEINPDREYPDDIMILAQGILQKYIAKYGGVDKDFKVINAEEPFSFTRKGIKWTGIIDLIYEQNGRRYIMDHKYSARHFRDSFLHLSLQSALYYYYYRYILNKQIDGFIYNTITGSNKMTKKGISDAYRFERYIVYKKDLEIENMWKILDETVKQIQDNNFLPHISRLTCEYCPYVEYCISVQKGFARDLGIGDNNEN